MALEENDKKALMILGIVAGIVVLVGGFLLLTGGGDDAAVDPAGAAVPAATGSSTAAPTTPVPVSPSPVVPNTNSFGEPLIGGRDPFSPFPVAVSPTAAPVSGSPSPTSGGEILNSITVDGNEVVLEAILERKDPTVEVTASGSAYRAGEGDTFARYYSVDAIDTGAACAEFRYVKGDVEESFTLCIE